MSEIDAYVSSSFQLIIPVRSLHAALFSRTGRKLEFSQLVFLLVQLIEWDPVWCTMLAYTSVGSLHRFRNDFPS